MLKRELCRFVKHNSNNTFTPVIKHYTTSHLIYIIVDNYFKKELQLLLLRNLGSVILLAIAVVLEDAST